MWFLTCVLQTVVAAPRGTITSPAGEGTEILLDHDSFLKNSTTKSLPTPTEIKKSSSKSSLHAEDTPKCTALCHVRPAEDDPESCSYHGGEECTDGGVQEVPSGNPTSHVTQPLLPPNGDEEDSVPGTVHQSPISLQPEAEEGCRSGSGPASRSESYESVKSLGLPNSSVNPGSVGDESSNQTNQSNST